MLCDWAALHACSSPVPTRCAACLLFMNACKATSAEANGTGSLPCSGVNNAFGTNLQSFRSIGGFFRWWSTVLFWNHVNTGPFPKVLPFRATGSLCCPKGGLMRCSAVVPSYFFDPTLIMMQNRESSSSSEGTHYLSGTMTSKSCLFS